MVRTKCYADKIPESIPDSIPIYEYIDNEKYGRYPIAKSHKPYTCGMTGKSYTYAEKSERSQLLARAFKKRLNWFPNEGTEWDRVMGIFTVNTVGWTLQFLYGPADRI